MSDDAESGWGSDGGRDLGPGERDGESRHPLAALRNYLIGLALAAGLTVASFWAVHTTLIYGPAIPMALAALAVAQMGIHLVFFLHLTTAPDNTNNVLALAFGILIVFIVVFGSVWIMDHLNANMTTMSSMPTMGP